MTLYVDDRAMTPDEQRTFVDTLVHIAATMAAMVEAQKRLNRMLNICIGLAVTATVLAAIRLVLP